MRWQSVAVYAVLLSVWGAFSAWQYRSYVRERELIEETLHQQARSVMTALVGGIQSHRRLGRFLELQLRGMLEELVKSPDVIAVSIWAGSEKPILGAGQVERLDLHGGSEPSDRWTSAGFQLIEAFDLQPPEAGAELGGGHGGGGGRDKAIRPATAVESSRESGPGDCASRTARACLWRSGLRTSLADGSRGRRQPVRRRRTVPGGVAVGAYAG
jgi:hypothetical protein